MKILGVMFSVLVMCCGLTACSTDGVNNYAAGISGPKIKLPVDKNQDILVLSTLNNVSVDVISENIFSYRKLGTTSIPPAVINSELGDRLTARLQKLNFGTVKAVAVNNRNVLNSKDIQTSPVNLTSSAKRFLKRQMGYHNFDLIILITQNGNYPLNFDLKCELKTGGYQQAIIEPHLYLYKIYLIDAHNFTVLTWVTGSANSNLQNTHLCKSPSQYSDKNFDELNEIVIEGLTEAVTADIMRVYTI